MANDEEESLDEFVERIKIKFAEQVAQTDALCLGAHNLPNVCHNDEDQALVAPVVAKMRDFWNTLELARKTAKELPYRKAQAVDGLFEPLKKRVEQTRLALTESINVWNQQKLAAERARREEERRKAEEAERQARAKLEAEQTAKAEAEAAAARARKQESAENHLQRAAEHAAAIPQASVEARQASQAADDARLETMAKPSDMVRTRTDEGRLVTMKQVPHVTIVDRYKLPLDRIIGLLDNKTLERVALALWKQDGYRNDIPGCKCEMRDVTEVR